MTPDGWEEMDGYAFREAGLLYMVNKMVLWPLGIALRVSLETAEMHGFVDVVMLEEPETIVEGTIDIKKEPGACHPLTRFTHFAQHRIEAMPTEMERETAIRAISKIIPGFAISPLRSIPEGVPSRDQDGMQEGS
jgi:hypothetical protein